MTDFCIKYCMCAGCIYIYFENIIKSVFTVFFFKKLPVFSFTNVFQSTNSLNLY